MSLGKLLTTIFVVLLLSGNAFAEGSKFSSFDRFATDAETIAQTRSDVALTPANITSILIHNSAFVYVSTSGIQTIDSNATFEKLDEGDIAYTPMHLENFTHSDGRLVYTGTPTRHFFITANMSIQSGETAQRVQARIAKNGTTVAGTNMSADFTAQTKDGCIGLNWIFSLATDDYIEIFGVSDTDADTFTVNSMTISILNEN